MGIKEVLAKFRNNMFDGLNKFEKINDSVFDRIDEAAFDSYVKDCLKEVNSPKYIEKNLQDLDNPSISSPEKEEFRKQVIFKITLLKE